MTNPKFEFGSVAYFRESAALGFIESVRIAGITMGRDGWMYTISTMMYPSPNGGLAERRSMVTTQVVYYSEFELIDVCQAYTLAEAKAKLNYDILRAQRLSLCPE